MKHIKRKIIKRIDRAKSIAKEYKNNENKLSTHGFWSFGYWIGRISAFEDCLDYLDEDNCDDNIRFEPEGIRQGKWIYDHWCEFKCSECGELSNSKPYKGREKYCPNCGAKMFEENKTND